MQKPTEQEIWIVENLVNSIKVDYRSTGNDAAETFVILMTDDGKKVTWLDKTFDSVADLSVGFNSVCVPKFGLVEKVKKYKDFMKKEKKDHDEYLRLKSKFEGGEGK